MLIRSTLTLILLLCLLATRAWATGELLTVRAPEEITEGDDFTLLVTATPREANYNRSIAIELPVGWRVKRSYLVEAGSNTALPLASFPFIAQGFTPEKERIVSAYADTSSDFSEEAAGVAYFFVISTKPLATPNAIVRAALVEQLDPNSPPEIDKKTKKPKPRNTDWRMMSPFRDELSFAGLTAKKFAPTIRLVKGWKIFRALEMDGDSGADARLRTRPEVLASFFEKPFTMEFWFKTTYPSQQFFTLQRPEGDISLRSNAFGQLALGSKEGTLATSKNPASDGIWHYLLLSRDSSDKLRLFVDAQLASATDVAASAWTGITGLELGNPTRPTSISIDELRLVQRETKELADFAGNIVRNARDTLSGAFGLFHFEEFGTVAHSSVTPYVRVTDDAKPTPVPLLFDLDNNAQLIETSSPVQTEQVQLVVDLLSPTKVNVIWKATSELGVKNYVLQRRVGSFGAFEDALTTEAKHSTKTPKRGAPLIYRTTYNAMESLPKLNGDIELYYRIAVKGFGDEVQYSESVKLEYGVDRDVFVEQNQPNPFNPTTTLAFRLQKAGMVKVSVFDIIGREVAVIVNQKLDAGRHTYVLDATNWPGGIYFYKVKTARSTVTRKMVLAK